VAVGDWNQIRKKGGLLYHQGHLSCWMAFFQKNITSLVNAHLKKLI
jgi:hypothetical protein